jgi:hypothetical protein
MLVEDEEGNLYRVVTDQGVQFQALDLVASHEEDEKLPLAHDLSATLKPISNYPDDP